MLTIRSIFLYLDRTFVLSTPGLKSLWDAGLAAFRRLLGRHPEAERKAVRGLLLLVERDRSGAPRPDPDPDPDAILMFPPRPRRRPPDAAALLRLPQARAWTERC